MTVVGSRATCTSLWDLLKNGVFFLSVFSFSVSVFEERRRHDGQSGGCKLYRQLLPRPLQAYRRARQQVLQVTNMFMDQMHLFCISGRGYFLALPAAGHAGGPACALGASLGPGRAPFGARSGRSKRTGQYSRDRFQPSQSLARHWKPHI